MRIKLAELAKQLEVELKGDPALEISGVATLTAAKAGEASFFHNSKYRAELEKTAASAVIVPPEAVAFCPCAALVSTNPYLTYAKLASYFAYQPAYQPGVHPSAVVDTSCQFDESVVIGAQVVIEAGVVLGRDVVIGPGSFIGEGVVIGDGSRLDAKVSLYHHVELGKRVQLASGVVVGSDGFGNAMQQGRWHSVPQLGRVVIEDDVVIGANTTIDRGALGDTRIGEGVRLDNQIQIGHNVEVGAHTAIAACVGIAGSTKIGRHCLIGGAAGISGHLTIADKVIVTGMAMITNSIAQPGMYSSGTGFMPNSEWRKSAVRFRQLDKLARQVKVLIKKSN